MPDERNEPEQDEMEGMLGTVLKSLFGKVDEAQGRTGTEPEAEAEGSVLRVVLDRVNGRLERADDETAEAIDAEPDPAPEEPETAATTDQEGEPAMSDVREEDAGEPIEPDEEPPPPPAAAEGSVGDRLSHPDAEVRSLALEELRGRPDDVPLDAVSARLTDPDPATRRRAVEILGEIPEEPVMLQLLDAMQDPSEDVRGAARAVFERRRSDSLVRLLRQELPQPKRGRAAAVLLSELGEVDMLIRAMADADPETRALIREVLEAGGVTERLIADLSDPHPDLRLAAADRLGVMRAMRAVPDLVRRLEDPDPRVRTNAAGALGAIGESSAIQPLKQALIADPDPGVVESLVQALRQLANPRG
ncbi:MAG TPA: HEAT repeat domain-containing protein [Actinomycetota bacterium]